MSETVNKETQARWEAAVFCDAATESVFRTVAEQSGRSFTAVIEGGVAAAKKWLAVNTAPAAVFVDVAGERFPASALAEVAQTAGPGCRLIAVGTAKDLTLYKTLLASGVFDYLVKPLAASDVTDVLGRVERNEWLGVPEARSWRVGQTVAVTGTAGGVGTTTLTALLGHYCADELNLPTVLVDYDRRKGDLALMLGLKADNGLAGILSAGDIDFRLIERTLLSETDGKGRQRLNLLAQRPGPETPVDDETLLQLGGALCELFSLSFWDIPSHRPAGSTEILKNADVLVIVTDYTVAQARTAKLLLAELGDAPEGQRRFVVVNRAHSGEKPVLTKSQFENFLDVKVAAELPFAGNAMETALLTGPVTAEKAPAFDAAVKALGARLLGRPEKPLAKASPLAALKALLTRGTKSC